MSDATDAEFDPFAGGDIVLTTGVTDPQQEIWLAVALGGDEASLAYNESVSMVILGEIDVAQLEHAIADLVLRHEALRTTFGHDGANLCV